MQPSLTEKIKRSQNECKQFSGALARKTEARKYAESEIQKGGVTDADRGAWQTQEDHDRRRVSIRFDKISNSIDWNAAQTMTQPPPCFTHGCRHSRLHLSWPPLDIFMMISTKNSKFVLITLPDLLSLIFRPALVQSDLSLLSLPLRAFLASVVSRWIHWRSWCISQVVCQLFAGFLSLCLTDMMFRYHVYAVDIFLLGLSLPLSLL